ncbi:beta-propeller domain-containing protein [Thiothrix fructosivorans]|uniref:Beta-propeller domain-containing protein n=1 Tax=Thiothrix fructosivorans TaxID=111770 RepID=A0A8B0SHI5_9GAMM|nr:beta-propeller domain-containing protein [Thiothrix fructosivorans]MBO0612947.1 beta-propeller domain-containing protein [Thiothrix fructosivorans]QTX11603.1 beta-propeller domain-containing protein [Thiothrix fructosivorans]
MKNPHQFGLSISIALLLSACGGGSSTTVSTNNTGTTTTPSTTASKPALKQAANNAELETLIKQQMLEMYGTVRSNMYPCGKGSDMCIMPVMATTTPSVVADTSKSVSSTNTQETNVDEADRIKTDGTYLYTTATDQPNVRIFKTNGASNTLVKDLPVGNDTNTRLSGLYLDGAKLVALAEEQQIYNIWSRWFIPSFWQNQQSQMYLLNVANPENPTQTAKLTVDGQVISSRRIGSTLYVATRHSPNLPNLNQYPTTEAEAAANRALIDKATLADFLPDYQLNGGSKNEIFSGDDCFMTQYTDKKSYQTSIVSLLAIDMNSATLTPQGKCFAGDTETLYASTDAIYLATTSYNYPVPVSVDASGNSTSTSIVYAPNITTDLHKFSLAGGINYRGSGRVDGHLGWNQEQKPFRMSEHKDVLRVVTYNGDNDLSTNPSPARLTTLQENTANQALDILATLPNKNRPTALGKPGEQIYATRFLGDKGYIVTFRTTDPLYLLDLSNPSDPFVASELKIDGYSDYLHPVGDNYLLGIGKDAIATAGGDEGRGAWYQGVKLSLIDITNPATPYEKQKIILGKRGTETAVSQSHHALTTLQQGANLQMALPLSLHDGAASDSSAAPSTYYNWTQDELYRLNINTQTGTMQALAPIVSKTASATDPYSYSSYQWPNDRSVMIGEFIHYLHGDKVISQAW